MDLYGHTLDWIDSPEATFFYSGRAFNTIIIGFIVSLKIALPGSAIFHLLKLERSIKKARFYFHK
jgi:hypothetical protein